VTHRGPCQPLPCCDAVISHHPGQNTPGQGRATPAAASLRGATNPVGLAEQLGRAGSGPLSKPQAIWIRVDHLPQAPAWLHGYRSRPRPSPTRCPSLGGRQPLGQPPPGSVSSPASGTGCWKRSAAVGCHGKLNVKLSGMLFMLPSGEKKKKPKPKTPKLPFLAWV